jgi:hypothetical protein
VANLFLRLAIHRIGQPAMMYLLTQTSIFAALPNNCYCQITGPAISEQPVSQQPIQRHILQSLSSRKRHADPDSYSAPSNASLPTGGSQPATKRRAFSKEKRKLEEHSHIDNPTAAKKRKKDNRDRGKESSTENDTVLSPSAILFKRTKIFYSRRYQSESTMLRHFLLADCMFIEPKRVYIRDLC